MVSDHSGAKKAHDWSVEQLTDSFHTTHRVKTQQVVTSRGHRYGDVELTAYLSNTMGPVSLVLDLCIAHCLWGGTSNPSLNGHLHYPLHYPTDIDRTLREHFIESISEVEPDSIVEGETPNRTEDSNQLLQDIRFKTTIRGWSHHHSRLRNLVAWTI